MLKGSRIEDEHLACVALAVVAEDCAEVIRAKYVDDFVYGVCNGITEHCQAHAKRAALHAVGQFFKDLQPVIDTTAEDVLSVLLKNVDKILLSQSVRGNFRIIDMLRNITKVKLS